VTPVFTEEIISLKNEVAELRKRIEAMEIYDPE